MTFQDVPNKVDFPAQERAVLKYWKDSGAFEQLRKLRKGEPAWSFIDGPITANNPMGAHHGWGRTYKDLMQRFRAMQGHELRYQNGFDCQGLWVEVEVEKEQGYGSKKDIETKGLEHFVRLCKSRVLKYSSVQTDQSIRLGYWMDWNDSELLRRLADMLMENPAQQITLEGPNGPVSGSVEELIGRLGMPELGGSYYTFSTENNYMIWTFLKKCWENGWLYRGVDVMPWCPRCATGISQHEIVTDGYAELTHRSVTVRFPLLNAEGGRKVDPESGLPESLLVWTTTPWTLTSNVAAAVGAELVYARVRQGEQIYYLAKGTLHMLSGAYELLGEVRGKDLVGLKYTGPFDELEPANRPGGFTFLKEKELKRTTDLSAKEAHQVIPWEAVGETEGTGIVHIAPGCGAEDFVLGKEHNLPLVAPLDDEGVFVDGFGWLTGMRVADVVEPIFKSLETKGMLYKVAAYTHRYPTCWRCKTELVFRLVDEWFISMGEVYATPRAELSAEQKAHSLRYQIMDVVDQIRWIPDFGYAREMDWLRNMHDWMISKKRYWGLALPIWTCDACGHFEVVGDEVELKSRAVAGWAVFEGHTPHRPFVDEVELECPDCHGRMKRVPDVGNPWLDAGVVPFSTLSYRSDPEVWRKWYPANWITESFPGQFRNWFYSLLAMSTVLDQSPPFLQNFGFATLLGEDGRPMHKSWGNSIEFNESADKMGVDVMRWLYTSQKPENDLLFGYHRGDEVRRQFLIPLWNAYSFFVTYANLDGWAPQGAFDPDYPEGPLPESENLLDRWVLARLNQTAAKVTDNLDVSDFFTAVGALDAMIDDLTNWYVRRSRRRFWKSEHDQDKNAAYATLYHVLVKMARLMAPVTPFVTEEIYQNLVRGVREGAHGSIHHTRWPRIENQAEDENLLEQMGLARQIASLGLGARSTANLKVRQPLGKVMVFAASGRGLSSLRNLRADMVDIIIDELNVKAFEYVEDEGKLVNYRILPDSKILGPKYGNLFPKVRAAMSAENPLSVAARVHAGEGVSLSVDGETVELLANEILVQTSPREGLAVASDKGVTVAIDSNLTPELRAEGSAREIVRRIQDMRKKAGFQIEDRIHSCYQIANGAQLRDVFQNWSSYLCAETLSVEISESAAPEGAYVEEQDIEGEKVTVGVLRVQA